MALHRLILPSAFALALALGAAPVTPSPVAAKGLESLADLAEQVSDAVVNISAATVADDKAAAKTDSAPNALPGTPFDDLFEEFFKKRGQTPPGGRKGPAIQPDGPRAQRSSSLGSGFVIEIGRAHV